jgi:hypothetical protein
MAAPKPKRSAKRLPPQPASAARSAKDKRKTAGAAPPGKTAAPGATVATKKKPAKVNRPRAAKPARNGTVRYQQSDGWEVIDVADGIAVHDGAFKTVHYLNHTAAIVFLLCKQPLDLDVLCAVFREEFGLKRAPKTEIRGILAQMETSGLLQTVRS